MPATILRLALPSPLRRLFDYAVPAGLQHIAWQPGMRLRVPFGRREIIGERRHDRGYAGKGGREGE